jgi:predicted RNA binding protein YcfA (HicA-like mRNA interferase family)
MNRREAVSIIMKLGFKSKRNKGHEVFKNENGETIILPNHREIDDNLWKSIKKQMGIK